MAGRPPPSSNSPPPPKPPTQQQKPPASGGASSSATATFTRPANYWKELPKELDPYNVTQWQQFAASRVDERTRGLPLMDNFDGVLLICVAYILLVVAGPAVFRRLLPKNGIPNSIIKPIMVAYNAVVICINVVLFVGFVYLMWSRNYNWICNEVDYTDDLALKLVYGYFLSKGIDFTDTVFMLLRGKFDQATFLHCYHHCSMFLIWWIGARYMGGGASVVGPTINCFIHSLMYSYYLCGVLKIPVPLFLKKIMTKLQISQLFFVMVYSLVVAENDCRFSHAILYTQSLFMFSLFLLFMRFYMRAYNKNKKE